MVIDLLKGKDGGMSKRGLHFIAQLRIYSHALPLKKKYSANSSIVLFGSIFHKKVV